MRSLVFDAWGAEYEKWHRNGGPEAEHAQHHHYTLNTRLKLMIEISSFSTQISLNKGKLSISASLLNAQTIFEKKYMR